MASFRIHLLALILWLGNTSHALTQDSTSSLGTGKQFVTYIATDQFTERYEINSYFLEYYEQTEAGLQFEDIIKPQYANTFKTYSAMHKPGDPSDNPFKPFQNYWVRLNLQSNLNKDSEWILFLGYISHAEVFIQYENGHVERKKAGFFVHNRELDPNEGPEGKSLIFLRSQSAVSIWIQFRNELPYPPELELSLLPNRAWQRGMNTTNLIQGIFQGLLWMILLYNLFLYISLGEITYLLFVAYVFFISIYFFNEYEYLEEYFLPESPRTSFYLGNLVYLASVFYIQFNRRFLNIPAFYPRWDRLIQIWLWLSIIFVLLAVPLHIFAFDYYIHIRNGFHLFYIAALILFIILVMFIRDEIASFFVLGNFVVLTGATFIVLGNLNIIPFSLYYLLGGIAGQLFVFSLALSYRYRRSLVDKQETQSKLIQQLKENEGLQTTINRNLESMVRQRTQEIAQQKEEIQAQNDLLSQKGAELENTYTKIQHSMRYAMRLQGSILGDESQVLAGYTDGFILFMPRDMVSGDFYWSARVGHHRIMVAADCTGHGIPGALMTILGNSLLNELVMGERITQPNEILHALDEKVHITLKKQTQGKLPPDGMDAVVIDFDEISHTLYFAGAKNPLYYVRDHKIHQIKGSNFPIGSYHFKKDKKFELQEMQVNSGDIFYLCSDGFQDQFGGEKGHKYLKKRFRNYLLEISHLPMVEQKHALKNEIREWRGNESQTDDILIVGLQF